MVERDHSPHIMKMMKKEDLGKQRLVSLPSFLGNVMEEIPPERTEEVKMNVMGSGQCGFTKGKSCWSDLCVIHVDTTRCCTRGEEYLLLSCT